MVLNINEVKRSGWEAGVTGAAETVAATLYNGSGAYIKIMNTHATSTMYYRIDLFTSTNPTDCRADPVKAATSINANTLMKDSASIVEPYDKAIVYVQQNSAAGTYEIMVKQYLL